MSTKTESISEARIIKGQRRALGFAVVAALIFVLGFVGVASLGPWLNGLALSALVLAALVVFALRRRRVSGARQPTGIGQAALVVVAALIAARWLSGLGVTEAYALVLLAVAWVVSTAPGRVAAGAVALVVVVEGISHLLGTAPGDRVGPQPIDGWMALDWMVLGPRLGLVAAFGLTAWALVGRRAKRRRKQYEREVERQRRRLLEEAREFRLIHAGRADVEVRRKQARELIVRDAVDAVHHTLFVTLELVKTSLKAHTVILLWFDLRNEKLQIKELISDSDEIIEGGIDPAGGVLGGITRQRDVIRLSGLRPGFRGLAYYRQSPEVTEFVGAPIIEQGHLRGVLCVDRCAGRPFGSDEQRVVEDAADYVLRTVENERMIASIEQTRFEVGRFYEASRKLNGVLTPREVYDVALDSVRQIVDYDFAAITLYDAEGDEHQVALVQEEQNSVWSDLDWEEIRFVSNKGLVSMVVRNCHYLPVGGRLRNKSAVVLTEEQDFSELDSLVVLPLIVQDEPVGTMIVGHRSASQFSTERREMLEVIANQVAVTMQNARLYEKMEVLAKFDGLTGLANRRTFQSRLDETMARHKRAGRTFGLVLTDIDHFKAVNDTYGHPVGDEVLRAVGKTLRRELREVDLPARYGGEEFALILEDTDLEGARQVAERLREAISELSFDTGQGSLSCTISMGIAMGPWDSDEPHTLVDLADQALYHSKEHGRNRVSIYREVAAEGVAA